MTAVEWLIDQMFKQGYFDGNKPLSITNLDHLQHQAKEMEYNQRGYTKEDVLKAGEIGEINHHDYKHIVKLLDEARQINETYGSKGSDEDLIDAINMARNEPDMSGDDIILSIKQSKTTSSQTEISDEEIYKQADKEFRHFEDEDKDIWIRACQWYREQLKTK